MFGGSTPAIASYLIEATGNRAVPGVWLMFAALCGLVATLLAYRAGAAAGEGRQIDRGDPLMFAATRDARYHSFSPVSMARWSQVLVTVAVMIAVVVAQLLWRRPLHGR